VEIGKEYDIDVADISRKGDRIARIHGFVIFIKNGKVGHRFKVKDTELGNTFTTKDKISVH